MAAVSAGFSYLFWYPKLFIPSFSGSGLVKPLNKHVRFIKKTSQRLGRSLFHRMAIYQQKLVNKQNLLNRFIDIGMYLFAMACACSYADSLYNQDQPKENSVKLADLFCQQTKRKIAQLFKEVSDNSDRSSYSLSKKILAGDYDWLEEEIIKGND